MQSNSQVASPESGTFRDPQGRLYRDGDQILRDVFPQYAETVLDWVGSPLAQRWMQEGRLGQTEVLTREPGRSALLKHKPVFFPSYPWEWTWGQWKSAGGLTLDLCEEAVDAEFILKDATPLNILFAGPRPVFVDVLSFEKRDVTSSLWIAYGQFVRTFLLPLAASIYLGWPLAATLQRRDGYEPADLTPWLGPVQRWARPFRSLVTLPLLLENGWLARKLHLESFRPVMPEEVTARILRRLLRRTRGVLNSLTPPQQASRWSRYAETAFHYKPEDHQAKQEFVGRCLRTALPAHVLDVGANTGVYSRIAADCGADVVAWDTDAQACELNWQAASRANLPILPLVADFARPTPAVGWQGLESASLLSRSSCRFDCVLMLGIVHHLLVADQIPLPAILDQIAEISTRWAVIEWIPFEDSQFVELCRGREELYRHLSESYFIEALQGRFVVRLHQRLANGRSLWLLEKAA